MKITDKGLTWIMQRNQIEYLNSEDLILLYKWEGIIYLTGEEKPLDLKEFQIFVETTEEQLQKLKRLAYRGESTNTGVKPIPTKEDEEIPEPNIPASAPPVAETKLETQEDTLENQNSSIPPIPNAVSETPMNLSNDNPEVSSSKSENFSLNSLPLVKKADAAKTPPPLPKKNEKRISPQQEMDNVIAFPKNPKTPPAAPEPVMIQESHTDLLNQVSQKYDNSFYFSVNEQGQFRLQDFVGNLKITSPIAFNLDSPSPFKVVRETCKPFHGKYSQIQDFNAQLARAGIEAQDLWITAVPVMSNDVLIGVIVGMSNGTEHSFQDLETLERLVSNISLAPIKLQVAA